MSNTRVCETVMTRQDLIVRALQEVLGMVDQQLAQQIQVEVSQKQGENQMRGNYGIGDIKTTDVKLNKDQLERIMLQRMEQEKALAQQGVELAKVRGDAAEAKRLESEVARLGEAIESSREYQHMYADVGFRFDKAKGTYTYVYDQDYDRHKASGFGKSFADEVAKAYACLEQLEEFPADLNAVQVGGLRHSNDDAGNPAVVAEVEVDQDTLVRLGLMQSQSQY